MTNLAHAHKSFSGITGWESWSEFFALSSKSEDRMSLVIDEAESSPDLGIHNHSSWTALWSFNSGDDAASLLARARREGTARGVLSSNQDEGAASFWDVALCGFGRSDALLSTARDVTKQVSQKNELRQIAYHDALTGLLNRLALRDRLASEIESATATGLPVAVLMLDLDNFKLINDTLGHDAGDAVLVQAADRLRALAPDPIAVGRLGGDEFALIVPSASSANDLAGLAEAVIDAMRQPITYKGRVLDTRASIGMAVFPEHGADPAELLKNADIALYAAKSFGRGGFSTYVPSMGNALRKRVTTLQSVREALAAHRVEMFYQPKVDLRTRNVLGFEALMRVRKEDGWLIPPHAFSQAFDDVDLARSIGNAMFERIAHDVSQWCATEFAFGRIAINASAAEFRSGDFAARFLVKLRDAGLSPELFEIEVSETVLAGRATDYVAAALSELADAGVGIILDDFGTGASSLAQLKRLPFDSVKIDRTFVSALTEDKEDQTIVRAIAGLADGLGLGMSAVGIETQGQLGLLRDIGCSAGQGNLLGMPTSASELTASAYQRTSESVVTSTGGSKCLSTVSSIPVRLNSTATTRRIVPLSTASSPLHADAMPRSA